jgi:hypothetical protein
MSSQKTNNSFLRKKICLRINHLPDKSEINVLDCFHGNGCIWKNIQRNIHDKKINVEGLDIKEYDEFALIGDNLKILPTLDFSRYDIIDVDAYGCPYDQIKIIAGKVTKTTLIFYTFIQTMMGALPFDMLADIGYSNEMVKKTPVLFSKNGHEKFMNWLSTIGVKEVSFINPVGKKYYGCFLLSPRGL